MGKRHQVSIVAIFRNEHQYLSEWLDYHIKVGVGHFYLYDNGGDHWDLIAPVQEYVTYHKWTDDIAAEFTKDHPKLSRQTGAYTHCLERYGAETEWLQLVDLDEFLVPLNDNVISKALPETDAAILRVPRINFGNSGHWRKPKIGSIAHYFRRERNPSHHKDMGHPDACTAIKGPHTFITEGRVEEAVNLRIDHHYTRSLDDWLIRAKVGGGQKGKGFRVFIGKRPWLAYLTYFFLNLSSTLVALATALANFAMAQFHAPIWLFTVTNLTLLAVFIWAIRRGQNEIKDTRLQDLYGS